MSLYRRGEIWWLYIRHQGVRVRQSCKTSDRAGAQEIHDQVRAELWRIKPDGKTVHGVLEAWEKSGARDSADGYRVAKFKRVFRDESVHVASAEDLAKAIPSSSPATFNRYANIIKAAYALAKLDPPELPYREPAAGRLRWLTLKEWRALRKQLPPHLKDMAEFALLTGLRQHNVTHLEWSQVDLKRKLAWIHADQAKARRAIGVPLSDAAVAVLRGRRGQSKQWVFPYEGRPLGKIKTAWMKALKRAKLSGVTWHTLRHTWASWHAMQGTPLRVLQELGSWQSAAMVAKYAHLAPGHLRRYAAGAERYLGHKKGPQ